MPRTSLFRRPVLVSLLIVLGGSAYSAKPKDPYASWYQVNITDPLHKLITAEGSANRDDQAAEYKGIADRIDDGISGKWKVPEQPRDEDRRDETGNPTLRWNAGYRDVALWGSYRPGLIKAFCYIQAARLSSDNRLRRIYLDGAQSSLSLCPAWPYYTDGVGSQLLTLAAFALEERSSDGSSPRSDTSVEIALRRIGAALRNDDSGDQILKSTAGALFACASEAEWAKRDTPEYTTKYAAVLQGIWESLLNNGRFELAGIPKVTPDAPVVTWTDTRKPLDIKARVDSPVKLVVHLSWVDDPRREISKLPASPGPLTFQIRADKLSDAGAANSSTKGMRDLQVWWEIADRDVRQAMNLPPEMLRSVPIHLVVGTAPKARLNLGPVDGAPWLLKRQWKFVVTGAMDGDYAEVSTGATPVKVQVPLTSGTSTYDLAEDLQLSPNDKTTVLVKVMRPVQDGTVVEMDTATAEIANHTVPGIRANWWRIDDVVRLVGVFVDDYAEPKSFKLGGIEYSYLKPTVTPDRSDPRRKTYAYYVPVAYPDTALVSVIGRYTDALPRQVAPATDTPPLGDARAALTGDPLVHLLDGKLKDYLESVPGDRSREYAANGPALLRSLLGSEPTESTVPPNAIDAAEGLRQVAKKLGLESEVKQRISLLDALGKQAEASKVKLRAKEEEARKAAARDSYLANIGSLEAKALALTAELYVGDVVPKGTMALKVTIGNLLQASRYDYRITGLKIADFRDYPAADLKCKRDGSSLNAVLLSKRNVSSTVIATVAWTRKPFIADTQYMSVDGKLKSLSVDVPGTNGQQEARTTLADSPADFSSALDKAMLDRVGSLASQPEYTPTDDWLGDVVTAVRTAKLDDERENAADSLNRALRVLEAASPGTDWDGKYDAVQAVTTALAAVDPQGVGPFKGRMDALRQKLEPRMDGASQGIDPIKADGILRVKAGEILNVTTYSDRWAIKVGSSPEPLPKVQRVGELLEFSLSGIAVTVGPVDVRAEWTGPTAVQPVALGTLNVGAPPPPEPTVSVRVHADPPASGAWAVSESGRIASGEREPVNNPIRFTVDWEGGTVSDVRWRLVDVRDGKPLTEVGEVRATSDKDGNLVFIAPNGVPRGHYRIEVTRVNGKTLEPPVTAIDQNQQELVVPVVGRGVALLIAIDAYETAGLNPLNQACNDARDLESALVDLGYDKENIIVVMGKEEDDGGLMRRTVEIRNPLVNRFDRSKKEYTVSDAPVDTVVRDSTIAKARLDFEALITARKPLHALLAYSGHGASLSSASGKEEKGDASPTGTISPARGSGDPSETTQPSTDYLLCNGKYMDLHGLVTIIGAKLKRPSKDEPRVPFVVFLDACRDESSGTATVLTSTYTALLPVYAAELGKRSNENRMGAGAIPYRRDGTGSAIAFQNGFFTFSIVQSLRELAVERLKPVPAATVMEHAAGIMAKLCDSAKSANYVQQAISLAQIPAPDAAAAKRAVVALVGENFPLFDPGPLPLD